MTEINENPIVGSVLEKIYRLHSNSAVEEFLGLLSISDSSKRPMGEDYIWKPVGESLSNAANIHTNDVSIAPIIERITNSYDAAIETKEFEFNGGNQMETNMPNAPRKAVERWWGITNGDTASYSKSISTTKRTEFANSIVEVSLKDSNDTMQPTIVIKDAGIGQSPEDFISTFLRLGRSNKITRPHLHGTYGHGGSSAFRFCDYTVIMSRRNPVDIRKDSNRIGWTIVRKNYLKKSDLRIFDQDENQIVQIKQPPVYEYLCYNDGRIPEAPLSEFPSFIGTHVAHIEYKAREWQNLSRGLGYRLFRNYLFDPVLPFRLSDDRENVLDFRRNMFGARSTLDVSPDVAYRNESEENLENEGKLVIRYWMLYDEERPTVRPLTNYIERENSRNTIIITLNGQRHGTLEKSLISKRCRLPRVADTLLVQVVVDDLDKKLLGELSTSDRGQLVRDSNTTELIQTKLRECLSQDLELVRWENRLSELHAADDESTKEVMRILDRLLDIGIESGIGSTDSHKLPFGVGSSIDYTPIDPPTDFAVMLKEDPIEIIQGHTRRITLEINAPDNVFRRRKNRGFVSLSGDVNGISVVVETNKFKDGRLPVELKSLPESEEYVPKKIKFIFDSDNLPLSLEAERYYIIIPESQYESIDPPTEFKFLRTNPIELQIGKSSVISLSFNGANDILTRLESPAYLKLIYDYQHISLIRRVGPNNGRIQYTFHVADSARIGDSFKITAQLILSNQTTLSDERFCKIVPQKERTTKKGDTTTKARPNYQLIPIRKEKWSTLNWNEENIGSYELKKDEEDKDCLFIYINLDSFPLESERQRRIRRSYTQSTIERIEHKYIAHIAYHSFQQFDEEKKSGIYEDSVAQITENQTLDPEYYETELKRVAKTLVLSFRGITDISND